MINKKLKNYIEKEILSQYDENNGHGKSHIESVIKRSFELNDKFNLHLDSNMIYVIAAYHDLGYKIDADNHEEVFSNSFIQTELEIIRNEFHNNKIDLNNYFYKN